MVFPSSTQSGQGSTEATGCQIKWPRSHQAAGFRAGVVQKLFWAQRVQTCGCLLLRLGHSALRDDASCPAALRTCWSRRGRSSRPRHFLEPVPQRAHLSDSLRTTETLNPFLRALTVNNGGLWELPSRRRHNKWGCPLRVVKAHGT